MNKLPNSWQHGQLGHFFETVTGSTPPKREKQYYGADIPFVKPPELLDDFITETSDNLSNQGASVARVLPPNSVLVSCIGNLGKVGLNIVPVAFNQQINAIVPSENAIPEFMFYQVLSPDFIDQLHVLASGTTVPIVNKSKFNSINIVLPPIPEQKRIVAILDEVFAGISQAVTNAEKNLANARELFESYLNNVFTQKGEGWENLKLKDISTKITDGVHKKPHYADSGVPFIKINNLTAGLGISFESVSYISREDHELFCKRTNPEKGDILITKDGTIGIVRIIDTDVEFSIFVSVALIKPIDKSISPYLKYVLESPLIQSQINPQGAALKHLYLRDLREFLVPLPPKAERNVIVKQLDSFFAESYRLETIYQQKLTALAELKQSILQKAFAGGLTADAQTTTREGAVA